MPTSEPGLTPEGVPETVAVNLLRHLEWQPDSFSVVFLFADVGPAMALAEWVQRRLTDPGAPILLREEVSDRFVDAPQDWLHSWLERMTSLDVHPSAFWLAMQRHATDRRWNQARRLFLARLNERRFLLERDLRRPLVLVLPVAFKDETRRAAPDLWHVRAFSHELVAARRAASGAIFPPAAALLPAVVPPDDVAASASSSAAVEWSRAMAAGSAETIYLPLAWSAVTELLSQGQPADAAHIAGQAAGLARQRLVDLPPDTTDPTSAQRMLSIALDNVGRVARAQGDWAGAEQVYRESLAIRRDLVERLGGSPEALRDISVSLDNVGRVAEVQGDWAGAEQAYREMLAISRVLVERLGSLPEALRDVSISLNNVGRVAEAQGDWAGAEQVYRESLAIRRELVERLGGRPEALRDVSVSLNNVGQVMQAQGEWAGAEQVYRESLAISREVAERLGGPPEALRDVSISLNHVGRVAEAQGDWAGAEQVYRESLAIRRELVERLGGTPEALRDVSVSLNNVGQVAQAQGDWVGAEQVYREMLAISRVLVERLGGTPTALDDLAIALMNNAGLPNAPAQELLAEAATIYASLVQQCPQVRRYADNLQLVRDKLAAASTPSVPDPSTDPT